MCVHAVCENSVCLGMLVLCVRVHAICGGACVRCVHAVCGGAVCQVCSRCVSRDGVALVGRCPLGCVCE